MSENSWREKFGISVGTLDEMKSLGVDFFLVEKLPKWKSEKSKYFIRSLMLYGIFIARFYVGKAQDEIPKPVCFFWDIW